MTMDKSRAKPAVNYDPPLWRGPSTPVPERIRDRGIDLARYAIDPKNVAKFQVFTNQKK